MRRISKGQEKQNCFCVIRELCPASPSLLGIYQKVSLRLTARAVPHKFPHHISSARCRKYFVEYFARYLTLSLCQYCHANPFPCTNLREKEAYMLRWRIFQTISLLSALSLYQHQYRASWRCLDSQPEPNRAIRHFVSFAAILASHSL